MRSVAFYAPMKPPDDPVPSGDRQMARNLMLALEGMGASVRLASDLRLFDGQGDATVQTMLSEAAKAEADRLITGLSERPVDFWVTYHNYYKAPDLIGPKVCAALEIPYILIEATRANSRLNGPWAGFAKAAHAACDAAQLIFYLTANDLIALSRDRPAGQHLQHLPPFLPSRDLPRPASPAHTNKLLSVGMMRARAKLASYDLIAQTLTQVQDLDWTLDIAGDGRARSDVTSMFASFPDRVRFLGALGPTEMANTYANSSLFFWPGVNEAFGMVYLEAQAAGLPVLAQDRPGLRDVLAPGTYPKVADGAAGLALALRHWLETPDTRAAKGRAARHFVKATHLLPSAIDGLKQGLAQVTRVRS